MKRGSGLKRACILAVACLLLCYCCVRAVTQRRRNAAASAARACGDAPARVCEGREPRGREDQVLTRFLYCMAGSPRLSDSRRDGASQRGDARAIQQIEQRKSDVRIEYTQMARGLDELEIYFAGPLNCTVTTSTWPGSRRARRRLKRRLPPTSLTVPEDRCSRSSIASRMCWWKCADAATYAWRSSPGARAR